MTCRRPIGRALGGVLFAFAMAFAGCGEEDDLPSDPAALRVRHAELGAAGRYDEATRVLQRLTDLANDDRAPAASLDALAEAWRDRLADGIAIDEPEWVSQALRVLRDVATRPNASRAVDRLHLDGLVRAVTYAWGRGDLDGAATMLHDVEAITEQDRDDVERRRLRALAWAATFEAALDIDDDSLARRSLERLDELARVEDSLAEERGAYLGVLERAHERVLEGDLVAEAAALRSRAEPIVDRADASPAERAAFVRMLGAVAVHEAESGRDDALAHLDTATKRLAGFGDDTARRDDMGAWLDARRYVVHRARRETDAAREVLARLEGGAHPPDASAARVAALASAWATAVRDAGAPEERAHLLDAFERLARREQASETVLFDLGRALVGAAERARADGAHDEAACHLGRLHDGATSARDPGVRRRLAALHAAVTTGSPVSPSDLPR